MNPEFWIGGEMRIEKKAYARTKPLTDSTIRVSLGPVSTDLSQTRKHGTVVTGCWSFGSGNCSHADIGSDLRPLGSSCHRCFLAAKAANAIESRAASAPWLPCLPAHRKWALAPISSSQLFQNIVKCNPVDAAIRNPCSPVRHPWWAVPQAQHYFSCSCPPTAVLRVTNSAGHDSQQIPKRVFITGPTPLHDLISVQSLT